MNEFFIDYVKVGNKNIAFSYIGGLLVGVVSTVAISLPSIINACEFHLHKNYHEANLISPLTVEIGFIPSVIIGGLTTGYLLNNLEWQDQSAV